MRIGDRPGLRIAIGGGALAVALSLAFQSGGVILSSDGWAYWEGATSLVAGDGYRYLDGNVITAWPPGFSIWLAGWIGVLGNRAGTLAVAHAVALGLAVTAWLLAGSRLHGPETTAVAGAASAAVLCSVFVLNLRAVLSESLALVWLGLAVLIVARGADPSGPLRIRRLIFFLAVSFGALATRNVSIAFLVGATAIAISLALSSEERPNKLPVIGSWSGSLLGAVAAWWWMRVELGQSDSHPAEWAQFWNRFVAGAGDSSRALASMFFPSSWLGRVVLGGLGVAMVWVEDGIRQAPEEIETVRAQRETVRALGIGAGVSWCGLLVVSASRQIADPLGPRFMLPVAALLWMALALASESARPKKIQLFARCIVMILALTAVYRGGFWVLRALGGEHDGHLGWSAVMSESCIDSAVYCKGGSQ